MENHYAEVLRTGERVVYLEDTETPAGTHYAESTLTPVLDEAGEVRHILYGARDVTEQKRAELQRRQLERPGVAREREPLRAAVSAFVSELDDAISELGVAVAGRASRARDADCRGIGRGAFGTMGG